MKNAILALVIVILGALPFSGMSQGSAVIDFGTATSSTATDQELILGAMSNPDPAQWGFVVLSRKNSVRLYFNRKGTDPTDKQVFAEKFTVHMDVEIKYRDENSGHLLADADPNNDPIPLTFATEHLTLEYDPASGKIEKDEHLFQFDPGHQVIVTTSGHHVTAAGSITWNDVKDYVRLETIIDPVRLYDCPDIATDIDLQVTSALNAKGNVVIDWMDVGGADRYELEWNWIDWYLPDDYNEFSMDQNASRISIPAINTGGSGQIDLSRFELPMVYERGILMFRVRSIGMCQMSNNVTIASEWYPHDLPNSPLPTDLINLKSNFNNHDYYCFKITDALAFESDKNWQYALSMAEDGKIGTAVSYADGSLRTRQAISRVNETEQVVVGETVYDHLGRQAVSILPVPVDASVKTDLTYTSDFNNNANGKAYSWRDFELHVASNQFQTVGSMDDNKGASKYYSVNNSSTSKFRDFIPDANGFPFAVTEFTNDGTGRVRRQGGVGNAHQLGTGHESIFEYGLKDEDELLRLFGSSLGSTSEYNASNYYYDKATDPNGQETVTFYNSAGLVIATGMTGDAPSNLESIQTGAIPNQTPTRDFMVKNEISLVESNMGSALSYKIEIPENGVYDFNYSFSPKYYENECLYLANSCYNCIYELTIEVTNLLTGKNELEDDLDDDVIYTKKIGGDYEDSEYTNSCADGSAAESFDLYLDKGFYMVTKTLKVSEDAAAFFAEKYVRDLVVNHESRKSIDPNAETCFKTYEEFYAEKLAEMDFSGCDYDCEECQKELAAMQSGTTEYENLQLFCNELCREKPYSCEGLLSSLLDDVSPGGQYAKYIDYDPESGAKLVPDFYSNANFMLEVGEVDNSHFLLSLLNPYNELPGAHFYDGTNWTVREKPFWRSPVDPSVINSDDQRYRNSDGSPATVTINGTTYDVHELPSVKDFVAHFRPEWALQLVPYHPEYNYYAFCNELNGIGAHDYQDNMLKVRSYCDALTLGYLNPLDQSANIPSNLSFSASNPDPYFATSGYGGDIITQMLDKMNQYVVIKTSSGTETLTIWEAAWVMAMLADTKADDIRTELNNAIDYYGNASCSGTPDECLVGNLDMVWYYFKFLYISERQKWIEEQTSDYAIRHRSYNECIGKDIEVFTESLGEYNKKIIRFNPFNKYQTAQYPDLKPTWYTNLSSNRIYYYLLDADQNCFIDQDRLAAFAKKQIRYGGSSYGGMGLTAASLDNLDLLEREASAWVNREMDDMATDLSKTIPQSWMDALSGCGPNIKNPLPNETWTPDPTGSNTYELLLDEFEEFYKLSVNSTNPFGARELGFGLKTANGNKTIDEIMDYYLTFPAQQSGSTYYPGCNVNLIEFPLKRKQSLFGQRSMVPRLDACACEKITSNRAKFNELSTCNALPAGVTTEDQLFLADYGVQLENIGKLACACDGEEVEDLDKTELLVPHEITCISCITCDEIDNGIMTFKRLTDISLETAEDWSNASPAMLAQFATYMNTRNGLNFGSIEYFDMFMCCNDGCVPAPQEVLDHWIEFLNELTGEITHGQTVRGTESFLQGIPHFDGSQILTKSYLLNDDLRPAFQALFNKIDPVLSGYPSYSSSGPPRCAVTLDVFLADNTIDEDRAGLPRALHCSIHTWGEISCGGPAWNCDFELRFLENGLAYQDIVKVVGYKTHRKLGAHSVYLTVLMANGEYRRLIFTNLCQYLALPTCDGGNYGPPLGNEPRTAEIPGWEQVDNDWVTLINSPTRTINYTLPRFPRHVLGYIRGYNDRIGFVDELAIDAALTSMGIAGKKTFKRDCNTGDCDECERNGIQLCDELPSNAALALKDFIGTTAMENGVFIGASTRYYDVQNIDAFLMPAGCENLDYLQYSAANTADGDLSILLGGVGCDNQCNIVLESPIEGFDFKHITDVTSIEPYNGKYGPVHGFKLTVNTGSNTYAVGANCTSTNIVEITGYSECYMFTTCETINMFCDKGRFRKFNVANSCKEGLEYVARQNAVNAYNEYIDGLKATYIKNYKQTCLTGMGEAFTANIPTKPGYYYTLYYYDQAGHLVQTIPPAGVDRLDDTRLANLKLGQTVYPDHQYRTYYEYNSAGQVIFQSTVDGGDSRFYYDDLSRLVFSQNAKQKNAFPNTTYENFSYTQYDYLGRIVEVGELKSNQAANLGWQLDHKVNISTSLQVDVHQAAMAYKEVVKTYYDLNTPNSEACTRSPELLEGNLRNRISYIQYWEKGQPDDQNYTHASYYAYDLTGNVKTLVQDYPMLKNVESDLKVTTYEYDLVSGNTHRVNYQQGYADQFYHKYEYDKDNKLKRVYTSVDGMLWEQDAKYEYYEHGYIARAELGALQVQGSDYAYTLHGWLKAVNGNILDAQNDMGRDGDHTSTSAEAKMFARDAFGFALGYYNNAGYKDYIGINQNQPTPHEFVANDNGAFTSLWNGNIGYMSVAIGQLMSSATDVYTYRYSYDQLNRLVSMNVVDGINMLSQHDWQWNTTTTTPNYETDYDYDLNGNITSLTRHGDKTNSLMDLLVYSYETVARNGQNVISNRLQKVVDAVSASDYDNDFDNDVANPGEYTYDEIGNLIEDEVEGIQEIVWNPYGKVKEIIRESGSGKPDLEFIYDATGNRIAKIVKNGSTPTDWTNTYYSRDASGNVLATYEGHISSPSPYTFSTTFADINSQLLDQVSLAEYAQFLKNAFNKNPEFTTQLVTDVCAADATKAVGNSFSVQDMLNAHESIVDEAILQHNATNLVDEYVDNHALAFWTTLYNANPLEMYTAVCTWNTSAYLTKLSNLPASSFLENDIYLQLGGTLPANTSDQITWLSNTSNVPTNVLAAHLVTLGQSYEFDALIALTPGNHKSIANNYYSPASNVNARLASHGDNATNITVLAAFDQNTVKSNILNHYSYCNLLSHLLSTQPGNVVEQSILNFSTTADAALGSITNYTELDYLTTIRAYLGETIHDLTVSNLAGLQASFTAEIALTEQHIYGATRLGVHNANTTLYEHTFTGVLLSHSFNYVVTDASTPDNDMVPAASDHYSLHRGKKLYELANHLGNVLTTISDRKLGIDDPNVGTTSSNSHYVYADYYIADAASWSDYYPFGMQMPGRSGANSAFADNGYRYGFNGMEGDDEVAGEGNSYTTHFRQLDSRLGRWFSMDPAMQKYPENSAYSSFNNSPIFFSDPYGDDPPERFGWKERLKNWYKGNGHLNKANKLASKNGWEVYSTLDGDIQIVANHDKNESIMYYSKALQGSNITVDVDLITEEELLTDMFKKLFEEELFKSEAGRKELPLLYGSTKVYDDVEGTPEGYDIYARITITESAVILLRSPRIPRLSKLKRPNFGKKANGINAVYARMKRVQLKDGTFARLPYIGKSFNSLARYTKQVRLTSGLRNIVSQIDDAKLLRAVEQRMINYIRQNSKNGVANSRNAMRTEEYLKYEKQVDELLDGIPWQKMLDNYFGF